MHKINRIGFASIAPIGRQELSAAMIWSGSTFAAHDTNALCISATDGGLDGTSVSAIPSGTVIMTAATRMALGQAFTIDVPFGDSVAIEHWGQIITNASNGMAVVPVIGHLTAFPAANMEIENLYDWVPSGDHIDALAAAGVTGTRQVRAYRGNGVLRRDTAAPIIGFAGALLINTGGTDTSTVTFHHLINGYRTLADQFAFNYYDPAR